MNEPKPVTVLREAMLDLTTQPGRSLTAMLVIFLAVGGLAVVEGLSTGAIVANEARFLRLGGSTVAVSNESEGLSAHLCASASRDPWALRSGGFGTAELVEVGRSPSSRFSHYLTTVNALAVISPRDTVPSDVLDGLVVGPAAANSLGVGVGDHLRVNGEARRIAMVMSVNSLRVPQLERALLTLGKATEVETCLIDVDRTTAGSSILAARAVFGGGRSFRAAMYATRGEFGVPPAQALASRPQRAAWLPIGAVLGAVLALDTWTRRSELSVQRATGGSIPTMTAIVVATRAMQLLPAAVAALSASVATVVASQGGVVQDQVLLMTRQAAGCVAVALLTASLATAGTSVRSSAGTLKDR